MLRTEDRAVKDKPKDIATLYSRAHLEAARYGDFSASRKQVRGKFRSWIVRETPKLEHSQAEPPPPVPAQQAEARTQAGRDDKVTRWYALRSVFAPAVESSLHAERQPPVFVFFSFAGGVGKTCLLATLGRALAALGEHVLLADTCACGMLPFYFGSRVSRPRALRTFFPPGPDFGAEADAPVQVVNLPPERDSDQHPEQDPWLRELVDAGRLANRILVDVDTSRQQVAGRLQALKPTVLVPVLPDMSSVACLRLVDTLPDAGETLFLLNQFDAESPLHSDVRNLLRQQLGDRLLPFVVRRSYLVSEALAEGMTVIDYAPDSSVAEDYRVLASWLRSVATPATMSGARARWTER
jgi:cellulose synthase operon protein YhjQ